MIVVTVKWWKKRVKAVISRYYLYWSWQIPNAETILFEAMKGGSMLSKSRPVIHTLMNRIDTVLCDCDCINCQWWFAFWKRGRKQHILCSLHLNPDFFETFNFYSRQQNFILGFLHYQHLSVLIIYLGGISNYFRSFAH